MIYDDEWTSGIDDISNYDDECTFLYFPQFVILRDCYRLLVNRLTSPQAMATKPTVALDVKKTEPGGISLQPFI
jgi:hypothetical protein